MNLDAGDVRQILQDAVVEWKGKLIYFVSYNGNNKVFSFIDLESGEECFDNFNFDDFDNPNVRLGYVNIPGRAVHMERVPARQYKMGVNSQNVVFRSSKGYNRGEDQRAVSFTGRPFIQMINGKYPDLLQAAKKAVLLESTVAFDRQFAVDEEGSIVYLGSDVVGKFDVFTNKLTFTKTYSHLAKTVRNIGNVEIG